MLYFNNTKKDVIKKTKQTKKNLNLNKFFKRHMNVACVYFM